MPPLAPQQHYGTIVIVGGGCYGSYYLRQLGRAARAGALTAERIVVVDRDERCRVSAELSAAAPLPATLAIESWTSFFDTYLNGAAERSASESVSAPDAIVPSPLMPHLMYEWLERRARTRWPGRAVETRPLDAPSGIPWQRRGPPCNSACTRPPAPRQATGHRSKAMPRPG